MKKIVGSILFSLFLTVACTNKSVVNNNLENGSESYEVNEQGLKHGEYKRFDAKKRLVELANYEDGLLEGQVVVFDSLGDTMYLETRKAGNFHGPYRDFYPGNRLKTSYSYDQNIIATDVKVYYENGQLKERVSYSDNIENGPFVEYHDNGKLKAEGIYNNGPFEQGELKIYDTTGTLERIMECNKGICTTTWKSESE